MKVYASATARGSIWHLHAALRQSDRLVTEQQKLVEVLFRVLYAAGATLVSRVRPPPRGTVPLWRTPSNPGKRHRRG